MPAHRPLIRLALPIALALALAACGNDDETATPTATATPAAATEATAATTETTAATTASVSVHAADRGDLKQWQGDLKAVGCYAGAVDGVSGPQTQAAIRAYQAKVGIAVDGLLGGATESKLAKDAAAGREVCTAPAPTAHPKSPAGRETGGGTGSATVSGPTYGKSFAISSCSLNPDLENLALSGGGLTANATGGSGSLAISISGEEDGVELSGKITAVTIGTDRSFTASGTFSGENLAGDRFTVHGSCPA